MLSFKVWMFSAVIEIHWIFLWTSAISHTTVLILAQTGELVTTVSKRKLQYFEHMIRAQNLCTYISEGRLDGARCRRRPRKRRGDNVKEWTSKTGEVHDSKKRQEKLERLHGASFRGLRTSAMKTANDDKKCWNSNAALSPMKTQHKCGCFWTEASSH